MTYVPKSYQYTLSFLEKELGKNVTSYFKNGYYKEITNSNFMGFQLFRHEENKIYYKHSLKDDTLWYSSTIAEHNIEFNYEIVENADTILGVSCDKLIYKDSSGTKSYYYSSEYSLDPEYYRNFTYYNKYEVLKLMRAIYLQFEMETALFKLKVTAINIKRKKLKDRIFRIPKHKQLVQG